MSSAEVEGARIQLPQFRSWEMKPSVVLQDDEEISIPIGKQTGVDILGSNFGTSSEYVLKLSASVRH